MIVLVEVPLVLLLPLALEFERWMLVALRYVLIRVMDAYPCVVHLQVVCVWTLVASYLVLATIHETTALHAQLSRGHGHCRSDPRGKLVYLLLQELS